MGGRGSPSSVAEVGEDALGGVCALGAVKLRGLPSELSVLTLFRRACSLRT